MSNFEDFLDEVCNANTLAKISREITGQYDNDNDNADVIVETKKKNDKTFPSPTLQNVLQENRPC